MSSAACQRGVGVSGMAGKRPLLALLEMVHDHG